MNELFKGYIETKNKQAIEKFKDRTDFKSLEEVKSLSEYAGVLAEDVILVDIDDFETSELLLNIVDNLELRCLVIATTRGKHFYFKNSDIISCKTHSKLACGLEADIKIGSKNSYSILKFDGKNRQILYNKFDEEDYEMLPKWLYPVKYNQDFLNMENGDGRNQALFNYILTLQASNFTKEEARETIKIINKYILKEPLSEKELNVIIRDEAFSKPVFYSGNTFLFDRFAQFLISNNHIIKINNQLHIYQDGIYIPNSEDIEHQMITYLPSLSKAKRSEVLAYLNVSIRENTKPADANLIAFKNGIYNIATEQLEEFTSDIIITNRIDYDYNPDSYNEDCDKTLNRLACNDPNIRNLLEELIGYCFYRRNELGVAFILTGDKSNGKSTFVDMVMQLLGDYNTSSLDLNELGQKFKTAELFGKLANLGDDIGDEFIKNPSIFKKLVTGDRVNVERKGQNPFDFNNYAKFLFSANEIPRIKDKTGAVLRRLIIIPFNAKFSKESKDFDPYIKYKLRSDEVMEYLINLGLKGLKRVLENRCFTSCEKVEKEKQDYEERNNPILLFFKEIELNEILNEPTKKVYEQYKEFCNSENLQSVSHIEFSKQVNKKFNLKVDDKKIKGKKTRIFMKVQD